jgi:glycosyltransferase involved in cell wall biosynthesis
MTYSHESSAPEFHQAERNLPERVLITGGRELGGVASVADALSAGFEQLGIDSEIISPNQIWSRWRDLRNPQVLKILSTTAVFSAPFARRAICIAHGLPCAAYQGWPTFLGLIGSYELSNFSSGTQLVAVSHYTALHLNALFNIRIAGTILNPLKNVYMDMYESEACSRSYITFVGRLVRAKNLHRLLPSVRNLLDENPGLKACVIGDGPEKPLLMRMTDGDPRFEFKSQIDDVAVRRYLRQTKIFISGHGAEGLGVTYLEALSQGCTIAMPGSGGGVELALSQIGSRVHLLPLSFCPAEVLEVLRKALLSSGAPVSMSNYTPRAVASAYLTIDSHFTSGRERSLD